MGYSRKSYMGGGGGGVGRHFIYDVDNTWAHNNF